MSRSPMTRIAAVRDLEPAYWRLLVRHAPRIAVDRLMRDIRSRQFDHEGLRARARDLRAHGRAEIRERALAELVHVLDMRHDGLEPAAEHRLTLMP